MHSNNYYGAYSNRKRKAMQSAGKAEEGVTLGGAGGVNPQMPRRARMRIVARGRAGRGCCTKSSKSTLSSVANAEPK